MLALRIDNLIKRYRDPDGGEHTIIDVPEFSLEAGQQVALAGESGSGKTTLLNMIAGILRADAGVVEVAGRDVTAMGEGLRDRWRATHIGYVFQTFNLLQGYTALENVTLAMMFAPRSAASGKKAADLLKHVGMDERLKHKPRQLSVGQQQRVALARALANEPTLVLADEPTGNLDRKHAGVAIDLIRDSCREMGAALLCVTHDQRMLDRFDDVRQLSEINRAVNPTAEEEPVAPPNAGPVRRAGSLDRSNDGSDAASNADADDAPERASEAAP